MPCQSANSSFYATVGSFCLFIFADKTTADTISIYFIADKDWCLSTTMPGYWASSVWALLATRDMMNWPSGRVFRSIDWATANNKVGCLYSSKQAVLVDTVVAFLRWQIAPGFGSSLYCPKAGICIHSLTDCRRHYYFHQPDERHRPLSEKEDGDATSVYDLGAEINYPVDRFGRLLRLRWPTA